MAALCPGVQYGLSSQENFGENKDLVFVKLTDSAYRAIEEYLKLQKQNKHFSRAPTIKFLGNEGQLTFPSAANVAPPPLPTAPGHGATPPSTSGATTTFNFSLSSTADMEGPGGSLECVQHRHQPSLPPGGARAGGGTTLAGLGPISHKMRIHATDDVYEETRKRMTFADKVQKNKCTREIKPNQTDIGRKVKVRQHHTQQQQPSSQSSTVAVINPSSAQRLGGNSGSGSGGLTSTGASHNMRRNDFTSSSSSANAVASSTLTSSSTAAAISSSSMPYSVANQSPLKSGSPYSPSLNSGLYNSGNNGLLDRISGGGNVPTNGVQQRLNGQQGLRSNHVSSSRPPKPSMSSISRRPLRERLIHLLALRPFKKLEIHERLYKEGLRERNFISPILKQISTVKDNCYSLNPAIWNDVQEEWPFYTEQEKQVLKRRKPQNLTPPGGSDGGSSTGSGNSPTSTHPGSPPSTTTTVSTSSSGRQRVAHLSSNIHYNQQQPSYRQQPQHQQQQQQQQQQAPSVSAGMLLIDNGGKRQQQLHQQQNNLPPVDRRDAGGMNPRSRQQHTGYGLVVVKRQLSDDDEDMGGDDEGGSRKRQCDNSHILSFGVSRDPKPWTTTQSDSTTILPQSDNNNTSPTKPPYHPATTKQQEQSLLQSNPSAFDTIRSTAANTNHNNAQQRAATKQHEPDASSSSSNATWSSKTNNSSSNPRTSAVVSPLPPKQQQRKEAVVRVSPDSQSDRIMHEDSMLRHGAQGEELISQADDDEYDYIREYTRIVELEQRRRYKNDFNAVYDEYKELHGVVEAVSHRFQVLDERLKREPAVNTTKYNEIKEQIMREYMHTKKDQRHQSAKRRFEYLHRKLSHIKDVVSQFDQHIQQDEEAPSTTPKQQHTATASTY